MLISSLSLANAISAPLSHSLVDDVFPHIIPNSRFDEKLWKGWVVQRITLLHTNHAAIDPYGSPHHCHPVCAKSHVVVYLIDFIFTVTGAILSNPVIYLKLKSVLILFNLVPDGDNLHFAKTPCVGFPEQEAPRNLLLQLIY